MLYIRAGFILLVSLGMGSTAFAGGHTAAQPNGQAVFEAKCANCHTGGFGGFFSGAPKVGDQSDWKDLLPKGVDGLTGTTVAGIGDMEARGGCADCTDAEIRAAVEYMVKESQ